MSRVKNAVKKFHIYRVTVQFMLYSQMPPFCFRSVGITSLKGWRIVLWDSHPANLMSEGISYGFSAIWLSVHPSGLPSFSHCTDRSLKMHLLPFSRPGAGSSTGLPGSPSPSRQPCLRKQDPRWSRATGPCLFVRTHGAAVSGTQHQVVSAALLDFRDPTWGSLRLKSNS